MSFLFEHVTAVTMDPAAPVLHDAFVLVEGTAISQVGHTRPQGAFDRVVDFFNHRPGSFILNRRIWLC